MTQHHYHVTHPRLRGVRAASPHALMAALSASAQVVSPLSPEQVLVAYGFKKGQYAGASPVKLGIGSLGGGVVQQDIQNAVSAWGMAAPRLTVRTVGGATNDPVSDQDSNVENMLDLLLVSYAWWWLTGEAADVTITFGPNASGGMEAVTRDLMAAGVEVASWSWGSAASNWDPTERAGLAKAFADAAAANVCFCAASGDNSVDDGTSKPSADFPCADPNVWAVGGTQLMVASDGSRAMESAWGDGSAGDEGGGGGYDPTVPVPAWQRGVVPANAPGRGVPDSSANADPQSGWQISANGSWTVVGGTSASSPFTAALIAVAKAVAKSAGKGLTTPALYAARATACNDVTIGSNGDAAAVGWDPATGLGSPHGGGFVAAIEAWAQGAQPPAPPPAPPPPPASPLSATLAAVNGAFQKGPPLLLRSQAIRVADAAIASVLKS